MCVNIANRGSILCTKVAIGAAGVENCCCILSAVRLTHPPTEAMIIGDCVRRVDGRSCGVGAASAANELHTTSPNRGRLCAVAALTAFAVRTIVSSEIY